MKKSQLTFGSLFTGIGGFDLGLERAGLVCKWQVEVDPFCLKVLQKHWPDVPKYGDIRDVGRKELEPVDVVCGGFPCQPFSEAGRQRGEQDDRNLWPEMRRIIDELRPAWVIAENVPGIRNIYLDTVLSDLESLGYSAGTLDLPAVAFGAAHIRHRLFIIAHSDSQQINIKCSRPIKSSRQSGCPLATREEAIQQENGKASHNYTIRLCAYMADPNGHDKYRRSGDVQMGRLKGQREIKENNKQQGIKWPGQPGICRTAHGVPDRVDRLRTLGNAIVPQVAEWIGRRLFDVAEGAASSIE